MAASWLTCMATVAPSFAPCSACAAIWGSTAWSRAWRPRSNSTGRAWRAARRSRATSSARPSPRHARRRLSARWRGVRCGWRCLWWGERRRKESTPFLKKRSEKLLRLGDARSDRRLARHPESKVFLLLFLQKKKSLPTLINTPLPCLGGQPSSWPCQPTSYAVAPG